jgi:hypothetical protein
MDPSRLLHRICAVQALYFMATGLWPILHIRSFMAVTGPKTDLWLVRTVGMLVIVIGAVLWRAYRLRRHQTGTVAMLGLGSAMGFLLVDIASVLTHAVGPVYWLDAAVQLVFLFGWIVARVPDAPWPVADVAALEHPRPRTPWNRVRHHVRRSYAGWILGFLLAMLISMALVGIGPDGSPATPDEDRGDTVE